MPTNFNIHLGEDYEGFNVGFRLEKLNLASLTKIEVSLYQGNTLLVTNTGLMTKLKTVAGQEFSTPFIVNEGSYMEEYWELGKIQWAIENVPTKVTIKLTDNKANTYIIENNNLVEANGIRFEDFFPKTYTGAGAAKYVEVGTFGYNPNHSGNELVDITTLLNVGNLPFDSIKEIKVELIGNGKSLASRTAIGNQIQALKGAAPNGKFSCSFVFDREAGSNDYWTSTAYDGSKPSKGVITIIDKRGNKYIAEKDYTGKWRVDPK